MMAISGKPEIAARPPQDDGIEASYRNARSAGRPAKTAIRHPEVLACLARASKGDGHARAIGKRVAPLGPSSFEGRARKSALADLRIQ
jgi:hypothetical protein